MNQYLVGNLPPKVKMIVKSFSPDFYNPDLFKTYCTVVLYVTNCGYGEIGRHKGLKIPRL